MTRKRGLLAVLGLGAVACHGSPAAEDRTVRVGTPGDSIIAWMGKAESSTPAGRDANGLLVEWRYTNATYLMGRREQDGVTAYRVVKITSNR